MRLRVFFCLLLKWNTLGWFGQCNENGKWKSLHLYFRRIQNKQKLNFFLKVNVSQKENEGSRVTFCKLFGLDNLYSGVGDECCPANAQLKQFFYCRMSFLSKISPACWSQPSLALSDSSSSGCSLTLSPLSSTFAPRRKPSWRKWGICSVCQRRTSIKFAKNLPLVILQYRMV